MTPEMYLLMASVERNSISRQSRRGSAVDSTLIASKRFLIVPEDSSAARMPLPGVTMASAILLRSARFMGVLRSGGFLPAKIDGSRANAEGTFVAGGRGLCGVLTPVRRLWGQARPCCNAWPFR